VTTLQFGDQLGRLLPTAAPTRLWQCSETLRSSAALAAQLGDLLVKAGGSQRRMASRSAVMAVPCRLPPGLSGDAGT
jgi:hypothetical protein